MIEAYATILQRIHRDKLSSLIELLSLGHPLVAALREAGLDREDAVAFRALSEETVRDARGLGRDLALLVEMTKESASTPEIVWTGPPIPGLVDVRATFSVARDIVTRATKRLIIAGFVVHVDVLANLGVFAALRRPVRTTILVDQLAWQSRETESLLAAGGEVIEIRSAESGMEKFHAKVLCGDAGSALVSSANFTHLGHTENTELGLLVTGNVAADVSDLLERYIVLVRGVSRGARRAE